MSISDFYYISLSPLDLSFLAALTCLHSFEDLKVQSMGTFQKYLDRSLAYIYAGAVGTTENGSKKCQIVWSTY